MAASSAKRLTVNPEMLAWAREWRGISAEEAATEVGQTVERYLRWETERGDGPTVVQARKLAELFDRSILEFFRETKPVIPEPAKVPDFRMHKGAPDPLEEREIKIIQMWLESRRANAIELAKELDVDIPTIPEQIFSSLRENPEVAALRARELVDFKVTDQTGLSSNEQYRLPDILRRKLEAIGILTIRRSGLRKFGMRGMCVVKFPLPVILFASETVTAQVFTIGHELAHIVLKQSGVSGPRHKDAGDVEDWCDRFSSAFLMPQESVLAIAGKPPSVPASEISDEQLKHYASAFRVSPHAMLIRLVHLHYVDADFYWSVKKPEFDEEDKKPQYGKPKFYGRRFQSSMGDLYTSLVIGAWSSGKITNHNAAEYMGVKNFSHLHDIRANFEKP
ncbi:MAG TPA: XRE family transcriptional regulator [Xanthobacteraceae bacterium]|nr:XRE family transcriptional regulator [Xanthobacteraceae bacterium]